jgi:hypothetical protein
MNRGSCLCGAVRFEAGPLSGMMHCHCTICRKHHGAMFATFLVAPIDRFRWLAGEDRIASWRSSQNGQRAFCAACGSVVPTLMPKLGVAFIPAGNLEDDPGARPEGHMFAASRAEWYPIAGPLPQYAGYPPAFGGGDGHPTPVRNAGGGATGGSCLCDAIAWEFQGAPERMHNCHCSRCRRARGAAHATNAFYGRAQLTWLRGEADVVSYSLPGAKRFGQDFCRRCGSPVPRVVSSTGYVVAPCGGLDSAPGIPVNSHIFVGSKAPWFEITDGLPQWEAAPA